MPIYEYECKKCEEIHERFYKSLEDAEKNPLKKCPECKGSLERIAISRSTFHLKGDGWYITEYGTKKDRGGEENAQRKNRRSKD